LTYSIVARDAESGEVGVAVQSRAFNTAAGVAWARPGAGAVASQAFGDRRYGYRGIELLATGASPADVLARLRDSDERREYRQVAMIDVGGHVAQHTGRACIEAAGHASGDGWAAQANMVDSPRVWEAMGEAFESTSGPLPKRLLAALEAAQAAGGDWGGTQTAGVLVVPADGDPWTRVVDVRVEDSDDPLGELRRLVHATEAYRAMFRVDRGRASIAREGGLRELDVRWAAILDAVQKGDLDQGRSLLAPLLKQEPRWASYVRALADLDLVPRARELLD
jgi:uncharacterized Ntn-hydrolase superfamily protein